MNLKEGYRIMFTFLDTYYWKHISDELELLLGSMSLLSDNSPADPAFEEDWEKAIYEVIGKNESYELTSDSTFNAMIIFLRNWAAFGSDGTISELCDNLEGCNSHCKDWVEAVNIVMSGKDDPYLHIT